MKKLLTGISAMAAVFMSTLTVYADVADPVEEVVSSPVLPISVCLIAAAIAYVVTRKHRK